MLTTQKEISGPTRVLSGPVKVHVVDPSAYTTAYDHALCEALARAGVEVELVTSRFAYGAPPAPEGYARRESFYQAAPGAPGSRARRAAKLLQHVPDMLRYRARAGTADVVHFQWLAVPAIDGPLLPRGRPLVLTAHDILPRGAGAGGARRLARRFDAVIAHSAHGRERLIAELGVAPERAHAIPHGAFAHLAATADAPLPAELEATGAPVVLCFGLLRPYKGLDVLLDAWDAPSGAELWIVGRSMMDLMPLRARARPGVRWVTRYVSDGELAACFRRADLVVAPYRESEQSGVIATALAFGRPLLASDVGGFGEVAAAGAAELVAPGDPAALREALARLLDDAPRRARLTEAALALASGEWSWERVAKRTRALYASLLS